MICCEVCKVMFVDSAFGHWDNGVLTKVCSSACEAALDGKEITQTTDKALDELITKKAEAVANMEAKEKLDALRKAHTPEPIAATMPSEAFQGKDRLARAAEPPQELQVKKLHNDAKLPQRAHASAGFDLFANGDIRISPGDTRPVSTGLAIAVPVGHVGLIRDRSSLGSKGIVITAGVIDSDYRGEWLICLHNSSNVSFMVNKGDKIAQVLILPVAAPEVVAVQELEATSRGDKGFGSTGK